MLGAIPPALAFGLIEPRTANTTAVRGDKERKDMWIKMSDSGRKNEKAAAANAGMREGTRENTNRHHDDAMQTPASSAYVSPASMSPLSPDQTFKPLTPPMQPPCRPIVVALRFVAQIFL